MAAEARQSEHSTWVTRIDALEEALLGDGRESLAIVALSPMRSLALALVDGRTPPAESVAALTRGLNELRKCIVDPERPAETQVFDSIAEFVDSATRKSAPLPSSPMATPPTPQQEGADKPHLPASIRSAANRATVVPPAETMMAAQLATSDDDEVDALLSSLEGPKLVASPPRAGVSPPRDEPARQVLMKGQLHAGLLGDLIQLFTQNNETGCLAVNSDVDDAAIFFSEGQVADACFRDLVGEDAFFQAMRFKDGFFEYQRGVSAPSQRIQRPTPFLIMDALRLIDEESM